MPIIEDEQIITFEYKKGETKVFPAHFMVKNCLFKETEKEEAMLLHCISVVAGKNGLSENDVRHIFPAILRMLKSDIEWSK